MEYMEDMYSGIYVFEGIDNVGKTTIVQKLKEKICETTEYECTIVAFPGNVPRTLGSLVYDIYHNQQKYFEESLNETSLQLLHIASHIDLLQRKLRKLSSEKCIVLLDRYWWSTYVYGLAGGMEENIIQAIIEPELLHWKDINVKKIFLLERDNREHDYEEVKDRKIVEVYRELSAGESKSILIDNNGSIDEAVTKIYNIIVGV